MSRTGTVEVVVGVVGRAHGIRGEVLLNPRTDDVPRRFAVDAVVHAEGEPGRHWTVTGVRDHSGKWVVRFAGVDDRSAAEALRGVRLAVRVPAAERPPIPADDPEADEFYDHQLIGLTVLDHRGATVGTVAEIVHLPAQDVLAVDRPGAEQALVPLVSALVPEIDLDAGRLVLADVPGLLDDPDDPDS